MEIFAESSKCADRRMQVRMALPCGAIAAVNPALRRQRPRTIWVALEIERRIGSPRCKRRVLGAYIGSLFLMKRVGLTKPIRVIETPHAMDSEMELHHRSLPMAGGI